VLFADPGAPTRVRGELLAELTTLGLTAEEARGIAHEVALPRLEVETRI
jgi:hypothetical protein